MPEINQTWFKRAKTDYETPEYIFNPLNKEFGFTLDVAATVENAKTKKFFTKEQDGLLQKWEGVCWMNPPFGREIKKWVKKAFEESKAGCIVVCLLPVRSNTVWWHDYVMKGEVRFIRGEVKFKGHNKGLWLPLAIVVFKPV